MQRAYVGLDISGRYRRVFSKQVLPSLVKLESQYQETCRLGTDRRKLFEKSIWTLRRLKVARELQRLYESHFGILDASFLFLSSHTERDVDVCVVFKNNVEDVGTRISNRSKLLSRPPLSKYELQIKI